MSHPSLWPASGRAGVPPGAQAGLGAFGDGDEDDEPSPIQTFAIVTVDANETLGAIHDRMPAILAPQDERAWLSADVSAAEALLRPAPEDWLRVYPVSRRVNDPSNDSSAVVEEIDVSG